MDIFCTGLLSIVTNFKQTKDAVSGPLAIVAAGADVARSDAASLLQFAAIVNVNLAMVNALPLPVCNPFLSSPGDCQGWGTADDEIN